MQKIESGIRQDRVIVPHAIDDLLECANEFREVKKAANSR